MPILTIAKTAMGRLVCGTAKEITTKIASNSSWPCFGCLNPNFLLIDCKRCIFIFLFFLMHPPQFTFRLTYYS